MRVSTLLALGICAGGFPALSAPAAAQYRGEWEADLSTRSGRVHLQLYSGSRGRSQTGFSVDLEDLVGLSAGMLEGDRRAAVRFELRRDAGTVVFEGQASRGEGWGDYTFTENPDFRPGMARLGHDDLTDREVFSMALHGVARDVVADLQDLGYRVSTNQLLSLAIHRATPAFIREMRTLGYDLQVSELLQFRIHGVTARFIADMQDAGFGDLRAAELVQARIHGVTPRYAREIRDRGYDARFNDLVQTRIHGLSADFIGDMAELGYDDVPLTDLVQMRIHGVTADFAGDMLALDLGRIRQSDLVQMRIHGVTARFAEEMIEEHGDLDVYDLVQMRIHGERRWSRRRTPL